MTYFMSCVRVWAGAGSPANASIAMASRSRSQWRKPSLLHKFVKNKAKRGSKTTRRKPIPFCVAVPSVHTQPDQADALAGELHDDDSAGMDMDDGALPDIDSDTEPMRCENQLAVMLELLHYNHE